MEDSFPTTLVRRERRKELQYGSRVKVRRCLRVRFVSARDSRPRPDQVHHLEEFRSPSKPQNGFLFDPDLEPLFSKNLFSLCDERWREMRNMLTPAFTSSKMKSMFVLTRNCAKEYGDYFTTLPPDQSILELKDAFIKYTNDVIVRSALTSTR